MARPARVTGVEYLGDRLLRIVFSDGLVRELDFDDALPGVLATVDDDAAFGRASVDPVAGTVCWPGGIDLDPDVLHGDRESVSPNRFRPVREYRLQQTS